MPRREWSRPFPEIKAELCRALAAGPVQHSDLLVQATGLPFEDVISALRMLRHSGEIDFEPEWEGEGMMRAAHNIRLQPPNQA